MLALGVTVTVAALAVLFMRRTDPSAPQPVMAKVSISEAEDTIDPMESPPNEHPSAGPSTSDRPPAESAGAMTPELAAVELAKAGDIENLSMRSIRCGNILFQLAQAGFLKEAWDLAAPEQGSLRDHEILRIMEANKVPAESRLGLVNSLTDNRDQKWALLGFCKSMEVEDILSLKGTFPSPLASPELRKQFAVSLAERVSSNLEYLGAVKPEDYQEKTKALVRQMAEMAGRGELPVGQLQKVLASDETGSPFSKWDLVSDISFPEADPALDTMRRSVIAGMVTANSAKAMEVLAQQPGSALRVGMDSWYQQDPGGANRWLHSTGINLPPAQRNQVLAAVVKISLDDKDPATAKAWADKISDPALRADLFNPP
jgi:hypothetical protein